jgi:hypothetical protein
MSTLRGKVIGGKIELPAPADWPEGMEVEVRPIGEQIGLGEEDWPETPEEIAAWLAWYDSLEPLILTPEDLAAWEAARKAQRDYELATWEERSRKLEKLFE